MKEKLYILLLTLFSFTIIWGQEPCNCNDTIEKNQNNQTYNYYPLEELFPYEDVINDLDYMIINGSDFYDNLG